MRKNVMRKWAVVVLAGIFMVALAGCGTKTEATDQEVPESSAVENEAGVDDSVTDEKADGEKGSASGAIGAEDESIVLYAETEKYGKYGGLKDFSYSSVNNILVTDTNLPIYNGDGIEVGYVKGGSSIPITEYGNCAWSRFKNPIDGTDYDYLYVMKKYVTEGNLITITTIDSENIVKEELARRSFDVPAFTSVTDDMEIYEFRIPSAYENEYTGPNYQVDKYLNQRDSTKNENEESIRFYKTYAVICTEDTDGYIICQIYYKDAITDEEWKTYRE